MNLIEARDLSVNLQGREILDKVSINVSAAEVVCLLGPNGSGKSTVIRALAKLIPATGTILIGGQPIESMSHREIANHVAVVPQDEQPIFGFTVREVVTMGRLPVSTGLFDTDEDRQAATQAMEKADCLHLQDRPITEISGGERQRALIARALAQGAPTILLDEPTSHLDPEHQQQVVSIVRSLAAAGRGIVVALHDLNVAAHLSDRAILMQKGRIAVTDATASVLASPQLEEVYGVEFERLTRADGSPIVLPRLKG